MNEFEAPLARSEKTSISLIRRFFCDEEGPTSVEYAVILAVIIAFCAAAISSVGQSLQGSLTESNQTMEAAGLGQ